jgi:hypothetical protein
MRFWIYIGTGSIMWSLWTALPNAGLIIGAILLLDFVWPPGRLKDPFYKPIGTIPSIALPALAAVGFLALYASKRFGAPTSDVYDIQDWQKRIMIGAIACTWVLLAFWRRRRLVRIHANGEPSQSPGLTNH